ncbi:hypothetical protein LMS44_07530 [Halomonas profundus]|nr:hypothetical protein LMS44_07530 [Halomonas profundus]
MSASVTSLLVHIGPLRQESKAILERGTLPALVITPSVKKAFNLPKDVPAGPKRAIKYLSNTFIAPKAGQAMRHTFNLPDFASLAPATGLKTLYPGVKEQQCKTVETQTLAQLMVAQGQKNASLTQLVIEQPENALELLVALNEEGLLDNLEALYVRTSPLSLYEGMATQEELIDWLAKQGFEHRLSASDHYADDPDFVLLNMTRNPLFRELTDAKVETASLKARLAEYESLLKENAGQLNEAATALRKTDTQLQQCTEQRDTQKQKLDQAQKELAKSQKELEKVQQELSAKKRGQSQEQQKITLLEAQLAQLTQQNDALESQNQLIKQDIVKAETQLQLMKEFVLHE